MTEEDDHRETDDCGTAGRRRGEDKEEKMKLLSDGGCCVGRAARVDASNSRDARSDDGSKDDAAAVKLPVAAETSAAVASPVADSVEEEEEEEAAAAGVVADGGKDGGAGANDCRNNSVKQREGGNSGEEEKEDVVVVVENAATDAESLREEANAGGDREDASDDDDGGSVEFLYSRSYVYPYEDDYKEEQEGEEAQVDDVAGVVVETGTRGSQEAAEQLEESDGGSEAFLHWRPGVARSGVEVVEVDDTESDDDDDDDTIVYTGTPVKAYGFRQAAQLLEDSGGCAIETLHVGTLWNEVDGAEDAASFRRLVDALARPPGEEGGGRAVRRISFGYMPWSNGRTVDVERLCRDVLPLHPTLEEMYVTMYPPFAGLLASSIHSESCSPLRKLAIRSPLEQDCVRAVVDMIRRDVPLVELQLGEYEYLRADECKRIFQAVASGNTNLRVLKLRVKETLADSLDHAVASPRLRKLSVDASKLSHESLARMTQQLRANTTMKSLHVSCSTMGLPTFRLIKEALETYNFTLREVTWFVHTLTSDEVRTLARLLRRNRRIRRAVGRLGPRRYHVPEARRLLPLALGIVSSVPALVYRLLRQGDVSDLCDILLPKGSLARESKKRKWSHISRG
jgi:hypothetical protein